MSIFEDEARLGVRSTCAAVRPGIRDELYRRFDKRHLGYIARVLTPEELAVVQDAADALIVARIKRMPVRRLARFDRLIPVGPQERQHYHALQLQWLRAEAYLLGTRLGRPPTERELVADFDKHRNGSRFRAYFSLKFPRKMRNAGRRAPPVRPAAPLLELATSR